MAHYLLYYNSIKCPNVRIQNKICYSILITFHDTIFLIRILLSTKLRFFLTYNTFILKVERNLRKSNLVLNKNILGIFFSFNNFSNTQSS